MGRTTVLWEALAAPSVHSLRVGRDEAGRGQFHRDRPWRQPRMRHRVWNKVLAGAAVTMSREERITRQAIDLARLDGDY